MGGRKPLPENLKVIRGTQRPGRVNKEAPKPEKKKPDAFSILTEGAQEYRAYIVPKLEELGVLSVLDASALDLLCSTFDEWDSLNARIKNDLNGGTTYETSTKDGSKMIRPYPEIGQRADAARRFQSLLGEFGLTPSTRDKLKVVPDDDPWRSM